MQKQKPDPIIEQQLYDDEELIWWGKPIPSVIARQFNIAEVGMSLVVGAFAIAFLVFTQNMMSDSMFRRNDDGIFMIVRFMFILVPLIMLGTTAWSALRPLRNAFIAQRTLYALTNKRAIVIKQAFSMNVQSYYDENVHNLTVRQYGNGVGDVIFATEKITRQYQNNSGGFQVTFNDGGVNFNNQTRTVTQTVQHGFLAVPDVRTVEDFVSQVFFSDDDEEKAKS